MRDPAFLSLKGEHWSKSVIQKKNAFSFSKGKNDLTFNFFSAYVYQTQIKSRCCALPGLCF